tara:strand:+ start:2631 stop:3107 length:477 start_codon:yes stop_codon:yes gene_type:complete
MDILIYQKEARKHFLHYVLALFGLIFVFAAMSVNPSQDCKEHDCPGWLLWTALGVGGMAFVGGVVALTKNFRWGSRINMDAGILYWWEGYHPLKEHQINLSVVDQIIIESSTGDSHLKLLDKNQKRIPFSEQCAPWPWQDWAQEIAKKFPHIQISEMN